jgi:hypothetical protein
MPVRTPYECARFLAEFLVDSGITRFSGRALTTWLLTNCGRKWLGIYREVFLNYLEYELGRMGLNLVRCRFNGEYNVYYITPTGDGVDCGSLTIRTSEEGVGF